MLVSGDWLAIHGAKVPTTPKARNAAYIESHQIADAHRFDGMDRLTKSEWIDRVLAFSGVVAVCRYRGFVVESDSPWFEGPYGWMLDGLVVLPEPVPCPGAQKLWRLPDDVMDAVRGQYRMAMAAGERTDA